MNTKTSNIDPEGDLPTELAAPARRALANAGIQRLEQLTQYTEAQVKQLHGIGPNAVSVLRRALEQKGLAFVHQDQDLREMSG